MSFQNSQPPAPMTTRHSTRARTFEATVRARNE
jgi:hypothetical protein